MNRPLMTVCHVLATFWLAGAALAADQPLSDEVNSVKPDTSQAHFDRLRYDKDVLGQKDLPNFHNVHDFLYRGGEPTEVGLRKVKDKGIATIIDLRAKNEKTTQEAAIAKGLGIRFIQLPMSAEPPTKAQVKIFMHEVRAAKEGKGGPVFVHCAHGSDRTGCLVGIWRVTEDGWSYDDAYKEMRYYWFTPKFTKLSGSVREHAQAAQTGKK